MFYPGISSIDLGKKMRWQRDSRGFLPKFAFFLAWSTKFESCHGNSPNTGTGAVSRIEWTREHSETAGLKSAPATASVMT
eukprot:s1142_g2.t1